MDILLMFLVLLQGHFLADYIWQNPYIAFGKNRHRPPDLATIPPGQTPEVHWPWVLTAHASGHSLVVLVITGNGWLMMAEFVAHWLIDFSKCDNRFGIHTDQLLHLFCKALWVAVLVFSAAPNPWWLAYTTF